LLTNNSNKLNQYECLSFYDYDQSKIDHIRTILTIYSA